VRNCCSSFVHIPFLSFLKEKELLQQEKFRLPFRSYYFVQIKRNNNYQSSYRVLTGRRRKSEKSHIFSSFNLRAKQDQPPRSHGR
jgi:hypothetical protein